MGQIQVPAPRFWPRHNPFPYAVWRFCSSSETKIDPICLDLLSPSKCVFYRHHLHSFSLNGYGNWYSNRNLIRQHIHNQIPFIQAQPKSGERHHDHPIFPETPLLPLFAHQKGCIDSWERNRAR